MRQIQRTGLVAAGILAGALLVVGCGSEEEPSAGAQQLDGRMAPQEMSSDDARRPTQPGMPAADVKKRDD